MLRTQRLTKTSDIFQDSRPCGFCHSPFLPEEEIVTCPQCGAVHHVGCWQANGNKCTTHLCTGSGVIGGPSQPIPHPTPPLPPSNPILSRSALTAALIGGLIVAVLGSIIGFAVVLPLLKSTDQNSPTVVTPVQDNTSTSYAEEPTVPKLSPTQQTETPILPQTRVPEPASAPTQRVPTPKSASANVVQASAFEWNDIGDSVRGRDLSVATVGYERSTAVVVVGSIQGDQPGTRDLVNELVSYYRQDLAWVPNNVAFYFLPSINPDGNATDSRYNANNVDLNRNWDTSDWKSKAAVPGYPNGMSGAGGSQPFSEPETRALRDLLLRLQSQSSKLVVVILHTSVNRTQGEVYPGSDQAMSIARTYANETSYDIEYSWAEYTTSGEAVTWCGEHNILALDIVIPATHKPSTRVNGSSTLLDITIDALESIAD